VGSTKNASNNFDFYIARLGTDGTLDSTFGTGGVTTTAIGAGDDEANGIGIQSDGKIVVGGYSHNGSNNDFAIARYTTAGVLDTAFNGTGKVTTVIGSAEDTAYGLRLDATNGKIVVGGTSHNGSNVDFASVRYWQ